MSKKGLCDSKKLTHKRNVEREHNTASTVLLPLAITDISIFIKILSLYYPHMNYDVVICESLKIIFHELYLKYRNVLPIILENILPTIFSYLCRPNRELKHSRGDELVNCID